MYNRPLSPHITIYVAQVSSLASIWHRITGLILTSLIVFWSIFIELLICNSYSNVLYFEIINNIMYFFYEILYVLVLFVLFYHALNGLKQILWDLGFLFNQKFLYTFFVGIGIAVCIIILLLITLS
uniref:SdhC n=1 Tax=Gracilaria salicornia TaxID=172968 RepID=A0A172JFT2_9FLOR|nr:SdhC [Gracilaria salicornia]